MNRRADALSASATTHCSGTLAAARASQPVDHALAGRCGAPASVSALYDGFDAGGLQYGPGYRTLLQAWGGRRASASARLRPRSTHDGTLVHPADLDDALCLGAVVGESDGGETRLPFAVDDARLQGATGALWAVRSFVSFFYSCPFQLPSLLFQPSRSLAGGTTLAKTR